MWISKKKLQNLEKRIADLEAAVRNQQKEITSLNYPYEDVKQAFAGFSRQTEKESRRSKRTNYQDMTESEKNEIIAYAAGTLQSIHKEINNVQSFLLITSVAKICILLAILIAILLRK